MNFSRVPFPGDPLLERCSRSSQQRSYSRKCKHSFMLVSSVCGFIFTGGLLTSVLIRGPRFTSTCHARPGPLSRAINRLRSRSFRFLYARAVDHQTKSFAQESASEIPPRGILFRQTARTCTRELLDTYRPLFLASSCNGKRDSLLRFAILMLDCLA